jgi:hypothetical protein
VNVRNIDFPSLCKKLTKQNVPLPDVYPDRYARKKVRRLRLMKHRRSEKLLRHNKARKIAGLPLKATQPVHQGIEDDVS